MSKAFAEMKARLGQGADPKLWAKEYPWMTVGAAAVAGFLTAYTLIPSKEEQALKRLARIERALNPPRPRHEDHPSNGNEKKEEAQGGMLSTILHEALGVVQVLHFDPSVPFTCAPSASITVLRATRSRE